MVPFLAPTPSMANTPRQAATTESARRRPPGCASAGQPAHQLQAAQHAQRPEDGRRRADRDVVVAVGEAATSRLPSAPDSRVERDRPGHRPASAPARRPAAARPRRCPSRCIGIGVQGQRGDRALQLAGDDAAGVGRPLGEPAPAGAGVAAAGHEVERRQRRPPRPAGRDQPWSGAAGTAGAALLPLAIVRRQRFFRPARSPGATCSESSPALSSTSCGMPSATSTRAQLSSSWPLGVARSGGGRGRRRRRSVRLGQAGAPGARQAHS